MKTDTSMVPLLIGGGKINGRVVGVCYV